MPKLSVIIPIYNAEQYLNGTIMTIRQQSYQDFEVILVDDGSTDDSPNICEAWKLKDRRIKVIYKNNGGVSSARNRGLEAAVGKYIAFVDADDLLEVDMYQILIGGMEVSEVDISMGMLVVEETYHRPDLVVGKGKLYNRPLELLLDEQLGMGYIWNKVFTRSIIGEKRFDESLVYSEDQLFIAEILMQANSVFVAPQILYHYMQHEGSLSRQNGKYEIWQGNFRARKWIYEKIIAQNENQDVQQYAFEEYVKAILAIIRYTVQYRQKEKYAYIINQYKNVIETYICTAHLPIGKILEYRTYIYSYTLASWIHYYPKQLK